MDRPRPAQAFLEDKMKQAEEPLLGGLEPGRVVKVGDTVRLPAGAWTATLQALLRHLRANGFPAPEPLGLDEQGREVVSFLPGRASNWPWPPALIAASGARQIGEMLKAYHLAAADFAPPSPPIWRHGPQPIDDGEIALHGDFGPHNLVWSDDRLVGVIDFELARPGRPMEDVGFAVIRAAQLRPDERTRPVGFERPPDRRARLDAFAEGYGATRRTLIEVALAAQAAELERIERLGAAGVEPWTTFQRRGLTDEARSELDWLNRNAAQLI
jgi:predicted transcriptional regulator